MRHGGNEVNERLSHPPLPRSQLPLPPTSRCVGYRIQMRPAVSGARNQLSMAHHLLENPNSLCVQLQGYFKLTHPERPNVVCQEQQDLQEASRLSSRSRVQIEVYLQLQLVGHLIVRTYTIAPCSGRRITSRRCTPARRDDAAVSLFSLLGRAS